MSSAKAAKEMPLIKPLAALGKDQHHKEQTRVIMQDTKATSNRVADASNRQPKTIIGASVESDGQSNSGMVLPMRLSQYYACTSVARAASFSSSLV
ncbi:MAG: hypothetical protein ABF335_12415 [Alphaproteobacteria bacterium]